MHKFLEISASNSTIIGKCPSDYIDLFEENMINVDEFMSDETIIQIIDNALNDKSRLLEMSKILCETVHRDHNLTEALINFDEILDCLMKQK